MAYTKRMCAMMLAAALTIVMAAPIRVCAWNSTGHQIAAYIAYKSLTKDVRTKVDGLLRAHPYYKRWQAQLKPGSDPNLNIFLLAATWPDDIRSDFSIEPHRDWHFIDLPFSTDGTPLPSNVASPNLLEAIAKVRDELGNSSVPDATRAYDLSWLIHLVGDAHQPVHCVTRFSKLHGPPLGDLGGNVVKIRNGAKVTSLHSYWDGVLGTSRILSDVRHRADLITKTYRPEKRPELSPEIWVKESFDQATFVYSIAPDSSQVMPIVTKKYDQQAQKIASQRIALAGYRLAALLNDLLR